MDATTAFPDTTRQDRPLAPPSFWRRTRLLIAGVAGIAILSVLAIPPLLRATGISGSVSRSRLVIAAVERGRFVRDFAADGRVVTAGSPVLYAPAAGTVQLRVASGDAVAMDGLLAVIDSPELQARLQV